MGKILFFADLHLGHDKCMKVFDKRPFKTIDEQDKEIIKRWNNKVSKDDTVYIVGDISWYNDERTANILKQLNGKIILIKGNHDKIGPNTRQYLSAILDYKELEVNGKKVILSHYPILFYNGQYRGAVMLYGHVHNNKDADICREFIKILNEKGIPCLAYNIGCMFLNYEPCTLEEIEEIYKNL